MFHAVVPRSQQRYRLLALRPTRRQNYVKETSRPIRHQDSAGKHLESYMEEMLFFVFLLRKMAVAVLIGEYRLTAPT